MRIDPSPDARVARRAARHHGLVTRPVAHACGLTDRQIERRLAQGRWVRLAPGVYRVHGAPETPVQAAYAAVLAAGGGSVGSIGGTSPRRAPGFATSSSRGSEPPQPEARRRQLACWRIQACIAMPLATPALIERVDPYWGIERISLHAARAASDRPGPS